MRHYSAGVMKLQPAHTLASVRAGQRCPSASRVVLAACGKIRVCSSSCAPSRVCPHPHSSDVRKWCRARVAKGQKERAPAGSFANESRQVNRRPAVAKRAKPSRGECLGSIHFTTKPLGHLNLAQEGPIIHEHRAPRLDCEKWAPAIGCIVRRSATEMFRAVAEPRFPQYV